MLVCPKCETKYAGSLEFCEIDGVRLEPESRPKPPKTDSEKTGAPVKDESAPIAANVDELHAQIRDLEKRLKAADDELKKLRAAAVADKKPVLEPVVDTPAQPEATEIVEEAEVMHGWLVGIDGTVKGKRFGIPAKGIKIGRGKRVQVLIDDENVSNTHAWIGVEKNRVVVRDQGSTNGTFINDPDSKRIQEARLSPGDTIIIGTREIAEFMFSK